MTLNISNFQSATIQIIRWARENRIGLHKILDCIADEATPVEYVRQMMEWFDNERDNHRYRDRHALCGYECICYQENCCNDCNNKCICYAERCARREVNSLQTHKIRESAEYELEIVSLKYRVERLEHRIEQNETNFKLHRHSSYCGCGVYPGCGDHDPK